MVTKNVRRWSTLAATVALAAVGLNACGLGASTIGEKVPPDEVALLVNQYGDEATRGIENSQLYTDGRVPYNPLNSQLFFFKKPFQTYTFSDDDGVDSTRREAIRASIGGTQVSEDVAVTIRVPYNDNGVAIKEYAQSYGKPFADFITNDIYRATGDCFNEVVAGLDIKTPGEYILKRSTAVAEGVQSCLTTKFSFLEVNSISVLGSPAWSDPAIQEQISARQASVERAEKAKQDKIAAEAEAATTLAKTQGEVDAQRARAALLADPSYAALRQLDQRDVELEIKRMEAEKWNGVRPNNVTVTGANTQVVGGAAQ